MGSRMKTNGILGRTRQYSDDAKYPNAYMKTRLKLGGSALRNSHETKMEGGITDGPTDENKSSNRSDPVLPNLNETLRLMEAWGYRIFRSPSRDSAHLQMTLGTPMITMNQGFSFEDELQFRLQRMTAIAKTLKNICAREREEKNQLFRFTNDSLQGIRQEAESCIESMQLIIDNQAHELKASVDKFHVIEEEQKSTASALGKLLSQKSDSMEELETSLGQLRLKEQEKESELNDLIVENNALLSRTQILESKEREHVVLMATLQEKYLKEESARTHLETLLEIAIAKVKSHEDSLINEGGTPPKASGEKLRLDPQSTSTSHSRNVSFDSLSMSSFDSEVLPSPSSTVSMNNLSDMNGRGSLGSLKSLPVVASAASPTNARKKVHRPKVFFKQLLKRSRSIGSPIRRAQSSEPLETITDEHTENPRCPGTYAKKDSDRNGDIFGKEHFEEARDKPIQRNISDDPELITRKASPQADPVADTNASTTASPERVRRNQSFSNPRSTKKGKLASLAKDLEKKIMRKRAKTADPKEFQKARQDFNEGHNF